MIYKSQLINIVNQKNNKFIYWQQASHPKLCSIYQNHNFLEKLSPSSFPSALTNHQKTSLETGIHWLKYFPS